MLSIEQCKKVLGDKVKNLTDESIEEIRDALYIQANLAFNHWQKSRSLTEGDNGRSPSASEELASTPTPYRSPCGRK